MGAVSQKFYDLINEGWPEEMPIPSDQEAREGGRRIFTKFAGCKPPKGVRITSGNRFTWVRRGCLYINPDRPHGHVKGGWPAIVHLLSHYVTRSAGKPHDSKQARVEKEMMEFVLAGGYHEGSLKIEPRVRPKPDLVLERYEKIRAREAKWDRALIHTKRMHAKAFKEMREYERRHGTRLLPDL